MTGRWMVRSWSVANDRVVEGWPVAQGRSMEATVYAEDRFQIGDGLRMRGKGKRCWAGDAVDQEEWCESMRRCCSLNMGVEEDCGLHHW